MVLIKFLIMSRGLREVFSSRRRVLFMLVMVLCEVLNFLISVLFLLMLIKLFVMKFGDLWIWVNLFVKTLSS